MCGASDEIQELDRRGLRRAWGVRTVRARFASPRAVCAVMGLLLAVGAIAACSARTSSPAAGTFTPHHPGVLIVATTLVPSPGFWEGTASHPTGGLEYELAKDLAERFGLKSVRIELVHFHRIVSGQLDGADLALDLITPTERA